MYDNELKTKESKIEGLGGKRALQFFGKNENRQNNSKSRMRVCLCVLNIVLHLFLLVFACFWRNKEENILLANHCSRTNLNVYAGFIVRNNKRFFVFSSCFCNSIRIYLLARLLKQEI